MAAQGRTFSECVTEGLAEALKSTEGPAEIPMLLARNLATILKREGYEVHRDGTCFRLPAEEPGRVMTLEERIALGMEKGDTGAALQTLAERSEGQVHEP